MHWITDGALFPSIQPNPYCVFKKLFIALACQWHSSLFFIAYIEPIKHFIFFSDYFHEKCKVLAEIYMSKETLSFTSNKSRFVVKLALSWFNLMVALLDAILWELVGTIFKIKIFLQAFHLFETLLGFVVSIKCSDTLPLTLLLGLGLLKQPSWLWIWDERRDVAKSEIQRSLKSFKFQAKLGPVQIWFSWLLDSECKRFKMLIKW